MALSDSLVINTIAFERIEGGKFINSTTNIDEPEYLEIKRTMDPSSSSSYTIKFSKQKNVVAESDDVLQTYIVVRLPHRSFTQSDVSAQVSKINSLLTSGDSLTRILRGEV